MKRKTIKANDTRTMKVVIGPLLLWAEFKWPQGHQKWWRTGGRDLLKSCLSVKTPNYQQEADSKDRPRSNNLGPWFCCCLVDKSCPSLCDPMDCSLPGSSVHGICQARILEWGAISFSGGIFPIQGSNLHLLHWREDSLLLNHLWSTSQWLCCCCCC